ncbi:hypothetical protein X949_3498 [Burkholderia pseudomallei MSHR5609]|nr:hypothetical protein X949_3498 [Burkholderia pseudomallei MSHR5609]
MQRCSGLIGTQFLGLQIRRCEKLFAFGDKLSERRFVPAIFGVGQPARWRATIQIHQLHIVSIGSIQRPSHALRFLATGKLDRDVIDSLAGYGHAELLFEVLTKLIAVRDFASTDCTGKMLVQVQLVAAVSLSLWHLSLEIR